MRELTEECLRILNKGFFEITDPGPLHQPIRSFSIRRNEKLNLILETETAPNATSAAVDQPPSSVRLTTERALLRSVGGLEGEFFGLVPYSQHRRSHGVSEQSLTELAQVHIAKTNDPSGEPVVYVIDWLENLPRSPYTWPAASDVVTKTITTRRISLNDGITITSDTDRSSTSWNSAKLTVDGITFYVCALDREDRTGAIKPGCIVYDGAPDDEFRKKVRTGLSFAMGIYLVDLGTTHYDAEWNVVSTLARSAYSLRRHAFDIETLQLAPLGDRFLNELGAPQLTRAIQAFVTAFDVLDLANLHWAFWHACAAVPHIAPAHFGAAIEGLQGAYTKANPAKVRKGWATQDEWNILKAALRDVIADAGISIEAKTALEAKLPTFNGIDQRQRLKDIMAALDLELGKDEDTAWRRRNKAAHGTSIPQGQELAAIRDMKLLRGLFQRLLLRITNAADHYIDYCSPNHNYRPLRQAPPPIG
ncbi:hypothetical protein HLH33_19235 [Gluconacetobacter diazotrophicus]|uniref:ApeA N-terminal domain-containing protein n=1 Tax=Gluconacetobacter diazotrophicus TaxID=33996 RepID=A0A7W4NIL1_GLUDI|nr:hypothetical protein [Gluconacetobacter diazotrophicus]MBB2158397.1 hypothetical protein [Gluconacetobacter diazotrophicus]